MKGGLVDLGCSLHSQALCFSVPQRNLTELVVAITDENIVGLFAALLAERRVLLTASKLSTVRAGPPPLWDSRLLNEDAAQWPLLIDSTI